LSAWGWFCAACLHLQSGLDIKGLRAHVAQGRYLAEWPEGTAIPSDDTLMDIPSDILIPAGEACVHPVIAHVRML